jgi:hypothetical protein
MNQPFVVSELCGRIATLTLNRPEVRNAIGTHQDCQDRLIPLARVLMPLSICD